MKSLLLGAAVLPFVLASAACGSDSADDATNPVDPTNPDNPDNPDDPDDPNPDTTAQDRDELAAVIGAHVRGEFALQLAAAQLSRGRTVEGFTMTSVAIDGSTGTGAAGGMSYSFTLVCHDNSQPRNNVPCDGFAHHSHVKVMASGSQSIGAMAMNGISRVVDWEIRDIALDKSRFRGPDDVAVTMQLASGAKYELAFDATYEQVRYGVGDLVPDFGTINFLLNVERTRNGNVRAFSSTALLTYTSAGATLALDGANYTIDLASGAVTKL